MSKGSKRRNKHISDREENLRWEYMSASEERKQEILKELEQIREYRI